MKKYSLHIVIVFISIVALNFHSCKPKKQEIPPVIDLHLDVKDENNKVIDSATVYLYDSKEAFDAAYANSLQLKYSSNGAVLTTKVVKGKIDFKELPSNKEYWVLIHDASEPFKDSTGQVILGYFIDKDNSEANYKIDGFQNGSIVTANIKLTPVSSLVKFDKPFILGPNTIIINDSKTPISISDKYQIIRKGSIGYQARTEACVWTGTFNAEAGKVITEKLVACNSRMIIFSYTATQGEVLDIYIGQNKTRVLANLSTSSTSDTVFLDNNSIASYYGESKLNGVRRCIFQDSIPMGQIVYVNIDKNCK